MLAYYDVHINGLNLVAPSSTTLTMFSLQNFTAFKKNFLHFVPGPLRGAVGSRLRKQLAGRLKILVSADRYYAWFLVSIKFQLQLMYGRNPYRHWKFEPWSGAANSLGVAVPGCVVITTVGWKRLYIL